MNYRTLVLEPDNFSIRAKKVLLNFSQVDIGPLSRSELISNIPKYHILFVRLGQKIDKEVINHGISLKVIASATTGLNHIDFEYAESKGVKIISLREERQFLNNIYATPEHTWALLLSLIRKIPQAFHHVLSDGWNRDLFRGTELAGKNIGIIGYGRIGKKIAVYANTFGMKVYVNDIDQSELNEDIISIPLDKLLEISDVITIHVPLNKSTKLLLDRDKIGKIKKGAIVLNTSRGEILDESALLDALKSGAISGACLDVLTGESRLDKNWMVSDSLISYAKRNENLLITPHLGGNTYESMEKTEYFIAGKIKDYFNVHV